MKKLKIILFSLIVVNCCNSIAQFNDSLKIDYFGQTPPGNIPVIFSPDLISTPDVFVQNASFSEDGKKFIYVITDSTWSKSTVMYRSYINGKWSRPVPLNKPEEHWGTPYFSSDGKDIYFSSPIENNAGHIFVIHQTSNGWSKPVKLGFPINTESIEPDLCLTPKGTMYFTSGRPGGFGDLDIYRSELENGRYIKAGNLGKFINTVACDECPSIAPDESYLVFNSWKYNPKFKGNNLYVCFHDKNGNWSEPKDLGKGVNTDQLDIYPVITPDGKYIIFTRRQSSPVARFSNLYWVSTSILDSVRNSCGSIFIPIDIPSSELSLYTGVYSNSEYTFKITIGEEKEHLSLAFFNFKGIILEALEKNTFWGRGIKLKFDLNNGQVQFISDWQNGNSLILTREK